MINPIMTWRHALNLFCGLLLFTVAACGSAPARQPVAIEKAIKAEHEAHRALRDGDLMRARELFRQSMLMRQSLDDLPATARASINLSSVLHKLGDSAAALELLEEILQRENMAQIPSDLRIAAVFRKGVILADTGKSEAAESAYKMALQECGKQCVFAPGISNLGARLSLTKGDFSTALAAATSVISSAAEKDELANARRIAASAESALEQYATALVHYQAALVLDKELALSPRIAEDLRGISNMLFKLGNKQEAEAYAQRAEAVNAANKTLH